MFVKKIKIDCDGVLRDIVPSMCTLYNDYYNENLTPDDVTDFDVNKIFIKCPNAYDFFFKEHVNFIYLNSPMFEKAKEANTRGACRAFGCNTAGGFQVGKRGWLP